MNASNASNGPNDPNGSNDPNDPNDLVAIQAKCLHSLVKVGALDAKQTCRA